MRAQMDGIRGIGGAEVHVAQLEIVCGDINRIVDGEGGTGFFRHILLPLPHFSPARKTGRSGHGKNAAVDKGQTGGFQIRSDAFNQVVQVGAVRQSVLDAGNVPCVSFPLLPHHGFQDRSMSLLFQGFHSVADGTEQFDVFFPLLILRSFSWVPLPEKVASAPGVLDDGPFFLREFFL